ncbi:GNAT family N-acetyltransferase [Agromyces soli]
MTDDHRSSLATDPDAGPDDPPALALPLDVVPLVGRPIRTARLDLRPIVLDDSDDVWQYQQLPEVLRYIPWPERDRDEAHAHTVRRSRLRGLAADGDAFDFAMVLRGEPTTRGDARRRAAVDGETDAPVTSAPSDDRVVGDVMLRVASVSDAQLEIGWVLHPDFQGRGIAAEAAGAVLGFAFETLHAHRVHAHVDVRNEASARLCERLGMRREATLREDQWDDGWQDTAVYAVLRREWRAAAAQR